VESGFLEKAPGIFSGKTSEHLEIELLRRQNVQLAHQIGEQAVDINFLKKVEEVDICCKTQNVEQRA